MGWFESKWFYKSGETAKFKKDEEVLHKEYEGIPFGGGFIWYRVKYYPCVILEITDTPTGGLINKEFVYTIKRICDNETLHNIYESELKPKETDKDEV